MKDEKENKKKTKVKLSYLYSLAEDKKRTIYMAIAFAILAGICTFIPFFMIYQTSLLVLNNGLSDRIMLYGLIAAVSLLLRFIFHGLSASMAHVGAYHILYSVRMKLCEHIGKVNLGFFTEESTGEIKKVLMEDVERLEAFLAHQIPDVTVAIVVPSIIFLYLLSVNVPMALVLLVPVILGLTIQILMIAISKESVKEGIAIQGKLNSALMEFVNGMPVMKSYCLTADSFKKYADAGGEYNRIWKKVAAYAAPMAAIYLCLIQCGILFTVPTGGILYLKGRLDAASYIFFVIMSIVFLSSYNNIMSFAQIYSQVSAGLTHIYDIMQIPELVHGEKTLGAGGHFVEFNHISFAYEKKEVLHDINLKLEHGTLTAFVGASGAGKSTAAQLIPRFWDVSSGDILVDGISTKSIKSENLMDAISFVFQEAFMTEASIYHNISMGKQGASKEEVVASAKAAQIHDFIVGLPDGYDTIVGSSGVKLSGGERQRICIARAILKNAPIIIFDEATSFTDIENEYKIQQALNHLLKGKTAVMIAHRLHTITHANKICVFDEGKLVEEGTHTQLLKSNGRYAKMWQNYAKEA